MEFTNAPERFSEEIITKIPPETSLDAFPKTRFSSSGASHRLAMEQAQERLKYDVDVGRSGLTGHYSIYISILQTSAAQATLAAAIWVWVLNIPPTYDYHPIPEISFAWLAKAALLVWTAKILWPLVLGLRHRALWKALEAQGLQWVRRNDHDFRVTYYRSSDGSLQYDHTTREKRLNEELQLYHYRWQAFWRNLVEITSYLAFWIVIPLLFAYLYKFFDGGFHAFSDKWNIVGIAQWLCFFFLALPRIWQFILTLYEASVYQSGAQFIPGAQVFDTVIAEKTLETMRAEKTHGAAEFVNPDQAARELAGPNA